MIGEIEDKRQQLRKKRTYDKQGHKINMRIKYFESMVPGNPQYLLTNLFSIQQFSDHFDGIRIRSFCRIVNKQNRLQL